MGGWLFHDDHGFAPEVLCGIFAFCRYIEQENEFLIVWGRQHYLWNADNDISYIHIATEIKQLQSSETELVQQQNAGNEKKKTTLQIIPTTQHILDNYDILTILEKNQLWKLVLKKVTVYRSQDDELSIQLYPNLPK